MCIRDSLKPDAEREQGYQERDLAFFKQGLQAIERRYDPQVDMAEWLVFLKGYMNQTKTQRVEVFDQALNLGQDFDKAVLSRKLEQFYQNTELNSVDRRLELMQAEPAVFEESDDPFIKLAVALYDENIKQENASKDRSGRFAKLEPEYMRAIIPVSYTHLTLPTIYSV